MIALAKFTGSGDPGREDHPDGDVHDPFRIDMPGRTGIIDLRGDQTKTGWALVSLAPGADTPKNLLGQRPEDVLTRDARAVLWNAFGIRLQLPKSATVADAIAEVLREHAVVEDDLCNPLQPVRYRPSMSQLGMVRRRHEIHLGHFGVIHAEDADLVKATQTYSENWPNNRSSAALGTEAAGAWTTDATSASVSANQLQAGANGASCRFHLTNVLDTSDNRIFGTVNITEAAAGHIFVIYSRHDGTSGPSNAYLARVNANSGARDRSLQKIVSGSQTSLQSDTTTAAGSSQNCRSDSNGSSIRGVMSSFDQTVTDTGVTVGARVGINFNMASNAGDIALNAVTIQDITSTAAFAKILGRGGIVGPSLILGTGGLVG